MNVATLIAVLSRLPKDAEVAAYEGESNGLNIRLGQHTGFVDLAVEEADHVAHDVKELV